MRTRYLIGKRSLYNRNLRDIKPENFLLKDKEDITNVKLIDFGLSKDYSELKVMQTPSGSVSLHLFTSHYSPIISHQRSLIPAIMLSAISGPWE